MTNATMNARIETKEQNDANKLKEIGRGAYASISEMVAALNCDYDRLEELRDEKENWEEKNRHRLLIRMIRAPLDVGRLLFPMKPKNCRN